MITTVHAPFDDRIFQKEAKSLTKKYNTIVIAPSDKKFNETNGDVKLFVVKKPKSKLLHPITFWKVFLEGYKQHCDIYHCHEIGSLFIGLTFKIIFNAKVIYDVHEHWPSQIPHDIGINPNSLFSHILQKIVLNIEILCSRHSDSIIAVSDSVAERFRKIGKKVEIIQNVPVLSFMDQIGSPHGPFNHLIYMGGKLQLSHGLKECIAALKLLKDKYPDISLTIVGRLDSNLDDVLNDEEKKLISVTGLLPYSDMYKKMHEGGIGILTFKRDYYNKYIGLPNKLFDYMLCGLPIVASDFPEINKIIKEADCGTLVEPSDPISIYQAIQYLLDHPDESERKGKSGRKAISEKYNWAIEEIKLLGVYDNL